MINFDDVIKENIKEHHSNYTEIADHKIEYQQLDFLDLEKQVHYLM